MTSWRPMTRAAFTQVHLLGTHIHSHLPERRCVFAERAGLFPRGCLVLEDVGGRLGGYAISRPIVENKPPILDSMLVEIDHRAYQLHIHDVAALPECRARGLASRAVEKLLEIGKSCCVISVRGTANFWRKFGFERADMDKLLLDKVEQCGSDAVFLVRDKTT